MQLTSNTTLINNFSKEIAGLKGSLEFTEEETEEKFNNIIDKISTMERNLFRLKKNIKVIRTTNPGWALEIEN